MSLLALIHMFLNGQVIVPGLELNSELWTELMMAGNVCLTV
jgi:hypothetical protein